MFIYNLNYSHDRQCAYLYDFVSLENFIHSLHDIQDILFVTTVLFKSI